MRLEAALHASHAADDSGASQRAWRVLGKPKDGQTLYLKPDSLPSSSLEAILQRFAPKRKLDQTIRVRCWPEPTSFYRYRQQSKELYDSLYLQPFAVIDESGRSVIVFDGRLRFGRINPEVADNTPMRTGVKAAAVSEQYSTLRPKLVAERGKAAL